MKLVEILSIHSFLKIFLSFTNFIKTVRAEAYWAFLLIRVFSFVIFSTPAALLAIEVCAGLAIKSNILEVELASTAKLSTAF